MPRPRRTVAASWAKQSNAQAGAASASSTQYQSVRSPRSAAQVAASVLLPDPGPAAIHTTVSRDNASSSACSRSRGNDGEARGGENLARRDGGTGFSGDPGFTQP